MIINRQTKHKELKEPVKTAIMKAPTKAGEHARKMYLLKLQQYKKLKAISQKTKRKIKNKWTQRVSD